MEIFLNMCKGYLLALLYVLAEVTSFSCVQALQGEIPDFELSSIRLFLQFLVLYLINKWNDDISFPKFPDYKWMVAAVIGYFCLKSDCLDQPSAYHLRFMDHSFTYLAF